ncbi:ribonuclease H-like domain-containing protein [Tanacetum coccineum]
MSHSTILIPSDSVGEGIILSPSLVILSNTKAEVMAIPVVLPEIALEAATTVVVASPTATPGLAIETDPEVEPSEAPLSPDYVPYSPIFAPASPDYHPGSDTEFELMEDDSEPIEDAPEAAEPLSAQVPTTNISYTTVRDIGSYHQYQLYHRQIPLDVIGWWRLIVGLSPETVSTLGDTRRIEEIHDHRREVLVARIESGEQEIETLHSRGVREEAHVATLRGLLGISRVRIADLEFQAEDAEDRLEHFGIQGLLDGSYACTTSNAVEWKKLDSLVKVWIYGTISTSLLQIVLKKNVSAHDVWKSLEDLFHNNKDARVMELHEELRSLELGSLSIAEYFKRIKVISDLLSNIDSPIDDKNLVMYAVNGLGDKYEHFSSIIRHSKNPLSLLETRSMLLLEESRLKRKESHGHARNTPSSSMVLIASSGSGNKGNGKKELCRNFQRGNCRFGARCRYMHGKQNDNTHSQTSNSTNHVIPPQGHYQQHNSGQAFGPTGSILGPAPNQATSTAYGPYGPRPHAPHGYWEYSDQPTTLPRAFNATTLRYADNNEDSGWYFDTGATSHLASDAGFSDPSSAPPM